MERLRFVSTGTEAVMSAIRVARAFTGRDRVLKFAGDYHGHSDIALIDAGASAMHAGSGIPSSIRDEVLVARYNDLVSVDCALETGGNEVAAIIVEPIGGNMGLVQPVSGFLEGLRRRADECGALLVFDEVIAWPRFGLRGAQGRFGVMPDLTLIGKIMGGGVPIAAFGGRRDVMDSLAPKGSVFTGGTHGGNPFCVAMAHRVLDLLESHSEYYAKMDALARALADGLRAIFERLGLPYSVVQLESVVDFKFRTGPPVRNFDEAREADRNAYGAYCRAMLGRGVLLAPSQNEVMFVSTAHTMNDIGETLAAAEASLSPA
jgi:glutamate-1-semialdehyde 2,1-aminomutase